MKQLEAKLRSSAEAIKSIGRGILAAGLSVSAPFAAMLVNFANTGSKLNDLSVQTGLSVERLQELGYSAEQNGSSLDDMTAAIIKSQRNIGKLASGAPEAVAAFQQLGLTFEDLKNLSPEKQFDLIAEKLVAIQNPTERNAATMVILGKSATVLNGALNELAASTAEFRSFGLGISAEDAKKADALGDSLHLLRRVVVSAGTAVASVLAPAVTSATRILAGIAKQIVDWVRANRGLVVGIALTGAVLTSVGAALYATGVGLGILGVALKLAAIGWTLLSSAVTFTLSPIGLILAGLTAATAALLGFTSVGSTVASWLQDRLGGALLLVKDTWETLVTAISNGDLEGAWAVVVAASEVAWAGLTAYIMDAWDATAGVVIAVWHALYAELLGAWDELAAFWGDLTDGLAALWEGAMAAINAAWDATLGPVVDAIDQTVGLWNVATTAMEGVWEAAMNTMRDQWEKFIGPVRDGVNWFKDTFPHLAKFIGATVPLAGLVMGNNFQLGTDVGEAAGKEVRSGSEVRAAASAKRQKDLADAIDNLRKTNDEVINRNIGPEDKVKTPGGVPPFADLIDKAKVDVAGTFSGRALGGLGGAGPEQIVDQLEDANGTLTQIAQNTAGGAMKLR